MIGGANAERGQRHGPGDGDRPREWRGADPDGITNLLPELAQCHRAQLDLAIARERPAAGGRWLNRAEVAPDAEYRDDPAIDRQLAECELRPAATAG